MAQIRKMDCQVEMKSSAEKIYDAYKNKIPLTPKIANQVIKDVKLVEGDWGVGSIRQWTFVIGGMCYTTKDMFERADDINKILVFKLVEGDMTNSFKSWRTIINAIPKGNGSLVKIKVEFEKQNDSIPDPVMYADLLTTWTKAVDIYLLNA